MVTLGIDASTTTIGWSFFSDKVLDCGFIDISKLESTKEKAYCFINFITKNKYFNQSEQIVLEAALSGFIGGRTSQQTIIKLIRWNAVFSYILSEEFKDKKLILESVNTIRKNVFGKCRVKGVTSKDYVRFKLQEMIPDLDKFFVYNKKGNVDKRTEDILDAITCSMFKPNFT